MKKPQASTVKKAIQLVVEKSVTFTVAGAISHAVPTENKIQKIEVFVGAYVIAAMVTTKASEFVGASFDELLETIEKTKEQIKSTKTEVDLTAEDPN